MTFKLLENTEGITTGNHVAFFHFSELLEKLCVSLYDVFRPLIIHVIHLETLSELCGILKNEVLEDHVQNNGKW